MQFRKEWAVSGVAFADSTNDHDHPLLVEKVCTYRSSCIRHCPGSCGYGCSEPTMPWSLLCLLARSQDADFLGRGADSRRW